MSAPVNCAHWSDCGLLDGGNCGLGLFGGRPSHGVCRSACRQREPIPGRTDDLPTPAEPQPHWGAVLWAELHRRALAYSGDAAAELKWLADFAERVIGCGGCRDSWVADVAAHPPDLTSAEAYFRWTWERHDSVRQRLNQPRMTLEEARERWGASLT